MKKTFLLSIIIFPLIFSDCKADKPTGSGPKDDPDKAVIQLTTETFKKLIFNFEKNSEWKYEGSKPAIIDFYADWCGPCKQFGPVMDELAKQGMSIKRLNVDYTPDAAKIYKVQSVPTVILVENEQEKARFTGTRTMQQVIDFYNQKNG